MEGGTWADRYTATATNSLGQVSPPATAPPITVDTVPPTVSMDELPAFQNQTSWTLRWEGNDPEPGTGVLSYDLQRLVGGSAYTLLVGVSQTEQAYQVPGEGVYTFRVRAGSWSVDYQTGADPDHFFPALASDSQGNVYLAYVEGYSISPPDGATCMWSGATLRAAPGAPHRSR